MIKYEVGKEFPLHNRARGIETCKMDTNTEFIDMCYYIIKPTDKDIKIWRKASIGYGFYIKDSVPFVLIDFPEERWNFDSSFNFHKVDHIHRENWVNGNGNILTLYLIDANTNRLEAMRAIGIETELVKEFRLASKKQLQAYSNYNQVDQKVELIYGLLSTESMINATQMVML